MRPFRLSDVGIRKKLFLLLLLLVVVPFLIYTTIIVGQVSGQMERLGFHTAELVLGQTANYLESRVDLIKRALDLISLNSSVRDLSSVDPQPYSDDPGLWIRDAAALHAVEDNFGQNNPDIRTFVLYMNGGLGASLSRDESPQFLAMADQTEKAWYQSLDPAENLPHWFAPGTPFDHAHAEDLHVVRRIASDQDLRTTVGYIRADIKARGFEEILDKAEFSPATAAFLVDKKGALVARSQQALRLGDKTLEVLASPGAEWSTVTTQGTDYRIGRVPVDATGWTLITAIPNRDIGAFGDQARNLLLAVLAVMLTLMLPLSLWAASSSTRRLDLLLAGVRRVGESGVDVELPENGTDEIGELTRNFNFMVVRIHNLLKDQFRLGVEVKNLELQALQAQINPHFLYNTLDLINGLALGAKQTRIVETTMALSKFYRLTLSGGADTLPLAKEVDHAATYLRIQNLRFGDAIDLVIDLEDRWLDFPVLKMILQPLVENSLLHGLLEKSEEKGRIVLRARTVFVEDVEGLGLEVEDDGVGMEPSVVMGLLSTERTSRGNGDHGYGVFNIDRRLRLRYGDRSGLHYESAVGRGTIVRVWIPSLPAVLAENSFSPTVRT
jgi:two-component system sensor histidine kinase YesM